MDYVLDTHIFLWWLLKSPQLSKKHEALLDGLEKRQEAFGISVMTLWEIAQLVDRGRFRLHEPMDPWMASLESRRGMIVLPLGAAVILDGQRLGASFPNDPADRLIVATARAAGATLLTVDQKIIESGVVATV